jgi:hypothetical protein
LSLTTWWNCAPTAASAAFRFSNVCTALQAKVAAQFAVAVEPELAGDIDEAGGGRGLDHVGVAGRLGQGLWINKADLVHGAPLLPGSRLSHDLRRKSKGEPVRSQVFPLHTPRLSCGCVHARLCAAKEFGTIVHA